MSYVTFITHYAKSLGSLSPKYEMLSIAVKYNLASIIKMGYRDQNNNDKFVKVRGVIDEGDDDEENAPVEGQTQDQPAQDSTAPTLANIIGALTLTREDFKSFRERSDHDWTFWVSRLRP